MLRASENSLGTWTTAAVLAMAILAFALPIAMFSHAAPTRAAPLGLVPASHVAPAVLSKSPHVHVAGPSPPVTASAAISTTFSGTTKLPAPIAWTITVSGATITTKNVSMSLLVMNGANLVVNQSEAVVAAQTTYSDTINYQLLSTNDYGGGNFPTTAYSFKVWVTAHNSSDAAVAWVNASSTAVTATLGLANAGALITPPASLYVQLPMAIAFQTSFSGNTGAATNEFNDNISIEIRYVNPGCNSIFGLGAPCEHISNVTQGAASLFQYQSSGAYALSITAGWFAASGFTVDRFPLGEYQFIVWVTSQDTANPTEQARIVSASVNAYIVWDPNSATFLSPSPVNNATVGNVTISVSYTADFLASAIVTVYSGATTTVAFSGGVFQAGLYLHAATTTWTATKAGSYRAVLQILTGAGAAAGQENFTEWFNLSASSVNGGGTLWYNQTTYSNTTTPVNLINGLNPGVAAAIFLVVGLVVGLIVAMVLGRMMMPASAPAQPWQATKPANECSICHQTFGTEAELKDHQRQAHGIG